MTHRVTSSILATLALLATLAIAPSAVAGPEGAGRVDYVNLGDSYSAASGVLPIAPGSHPFCLQSSANFAHGIATTLGYQLTDVSCGAAKTKDFTSSQYPGVAPQLDALSPSTDLVTMTIGGNDNNIFASVILQCGSLGLLSLGQGSPCKNRYGDSFATTITTSTYANVVAALNAVKAKAPNARVAISGVPWVVPATGGCFTKMPIASGDVPYVHRIQAILNRTFAKAAAATGVTYVDQSIVSEGHDACKRVGVRWVEPALFSTQPVPVHPNALGERGMADQIIATLNLD